MTIIINEEVTNKKYDIKEHQHIIIPSACTVVIVGPNSSELPEYKGNIDLPVLHLKYNEINKLTIRATENSSLNVETHSVTNFSLEKFIVVHGIDVKDTNCCNFKDTNVNGVHYHFRDIINLDILGQGRLTDSGIFGDILFEPKTYDEISKLY